jgi:hypothetical protein
VVCKLPLHAWQDSEKISVHPSTPINALFSFTSHEEILKKFYFVRRIIRLQKKKKKTKKMKEKKRQTERGKRKGTRRKRQRCYGLDLVCPLRAQCPGRLVPNVVLLLQ